MKHAPTSGTTPVHGDLPVTLVTGVPALLGPVSSYEWIYLEFSIESYDVILILSLKDPFSPKQGALPSVYLTVHERTPKGAKLVCYLYNLFRYLAAADFLGAVEHWWNGSFKEEITLNCVDFTLTHKVNITVKLHDSGILCERAHLSGKASAASSIDALPSPLPLSGTAHPRALHQWQCLGHGLAATVSLTMSPLGAGGLRSGRALRDFAHREFGLFDVPLATQLRFAQPLKLPEQMARCYLDKNAGTEPLWHIKEPWLWWHVAHPHEVGLVFPHRAGLGYRVRGMGWGPHLTFESWQAGACTAVWQLATSGFGLRHTGVVAHGQARRVFRDVIESAPFYVRRRPRYPGREPGAPSPSEWACPESLEFLEPRAIDTPWCQFLMGMRRIYVTLPLA